MVGTLPLSALLLICVPARGYRAKVHEQFTVDDALRRFAAAGSDLDAFMEAVESNRVSSDDAGPRKGPPNYWPLTWRSKLRGNKFLGKGAFGTVRGSKVMCAEPTVDVAIKEQKYKPEVEMEAAFMKAFSGPEFVKLYESYRPKTARTKFLMLMESAGGGELSDMVGSGAFSMRRKATVFMDTLRGVAEMNAQGAVHRDLKPANILLSSKVAGRGKVADLGLACVTKSSPHKNLYKLAPCTGVAGTPLYMSPETVTKKSPPVGPWIDSWALGMILYELYSGDLPNSLLVASSIDSLFKKIKGFDVQKDKQFQKIAAATPTVGQLISGFLKHDMNSRLTAADALPIAEAWVTSLDGSLSKPEVQDMPACFWETAAEEPAAVAEPTAADEEEDDEDAEGNYVITINDPKTNIQANILGSSVGKDGVLVMSEGNKKYSHKQLRNGDRLISINGIKFPRCMDHTTWPLLRDGGMGSKLVVKLQHKTR